MEFIEKVLGGERGWKEGRHRERVREGREDRRGEGGSRVQSPGKVPRRVEGPLGLLGFRLPISGTRC